MNNHYKIKNLEREIENISQALRDCDRVDLQAHLNLRLEEKKLEYEERTGRKYTLYRDGKK